MTKILWPHKYMGGNNTWKGLNINSWPINHHSLCIKFCYEFCILLHYIFDAHYFLVSDALEDNIQWTSSSPNFRRARVFIDYELKNYTLTYNFFHNLWSFLTKQSIIWMKFNECFSDSLHQVYFSLFILEKKFW